jgi:hypothetical protein
LSGCCNRWNGLRCWHGIVDSTVSNAVIVVLFGIACVPPDDEEGLVVVPDEPAAFDAAVLGLGGGRTISGSFFLLLKSIHNTNQQYKFYKFRYEIIYKGTKQSHWACQFVYADFW